MKKLPINKTPKAVIAVMRAAAAFCAKKFAAKVEFAGRDFLMRGVAPAKEER